MNRILTIALLLLINIATSSPRAAAQEYAGPLRYNALLSNNRHTTPNNKTARKTMSVLNLPFFEDFTGYDIYPDTANWVDFEVYVNNTMCVNPVARGVATFDALNSIGVPYDSFSNTNFRYADSLTSQPINLDLGTVTPGDSVYLSFFYQPQGNSFYPLIQDSLELYMKTQYGGYVMIWATPGSTLQPFQQVMIPITDSIYFHGAFQFRFVNIAALDWADAIWNVDYIRLDKNRNMNDTVISDIAFSTNPSFLLNDYTSMPYRQFMANPPSERAPEYNNTINNTWLVPQPVTYDFSAVALKNGQVLQTTISSTATLAPATTTPVINGAYTATITPTLVGKDEKVVFENTFYIESGAATGSAPNDTIVKDMVFDNYLAYDDGSAEKSYYLNLLPTLPGKIAIEYHLNIPDTLRGVAIYFGRQIPFPGYKAFSLMVYSQLEGVNGATADNLLLEQDLNIPYYVDTVNHFTVYKFDSAMRMPAGTFYMGTLQPPSSGDDSIYFGLDVNRIGSNHAYYNVLNVWQPSLISGAIMIRPLLGQPVVSSGVGELDNKKYEWQVMPNPAKDQLQFEFESSEQQQYRITDIQGRKVLEGTILSGKSVDISQLTPGMYFVNLTGDGIPVAPKKIIKL